MRIKMRKYRLKKENAEDRSAGEAWNEDDYTYTIPRRNGGKPDESSLILVGQKWTTLCPYAIDVFRHREKRDKFGCAILDTYADNRHAAGGAVLAREWKEYLPGKAIVEVVLNNSEQLTSEHTWLRNAYGAYGLGFNVTAREKSKDKDPWIVLQYKHVRSDPRPVSGNGTYSKKGGGRGLDGVLKDGQYGPSKEYDGQNSEYK